MRQNSIVKQLCICVLVFVMTFICFPSISAAFVGGLPNELFSNAPYSSELSAQQELIEKNPTIVRSRYVLINFDNLVSKSLPEGADSIMLKLFNDVSLIAVKNRLEVRSKNRYTWFGRIEGVKQGQVILTVENGSMAGNITVNETMYQVRKFGNGIHVIYEINQSAFPEEAPSTPIMIPPDASKNIAPSTGAEDDGSIIEVMVVYTPAAAASSGNIQSEIQLAVDETNQSYSNSGINQRIRLAHSEQVVYTEPSGSCSISQYRDRLQNPLDGYMDNVHSLRDAYKADLVVLIVENGCSYCGVAYIMTNVSTSFEAYGFSVVARSCATGYYSFGHELGHIMSARHDWYVDPTNYSPYTYNHGYVYLPNRWRTIMAYNTECGDNGFSCTRLQYWSNPDVLYGGVPMGVPEGQSNAADNRKTLNNTAYTVANFRVSTGGGIDIKWDSYCDGMNVNFSGLVIYGTRTGCSAGIKMIGDIGLGPNNQIALTLSTLNSGDPSLVETFYVYLNQTWELWVSYGTSVSLLNTGTWSIGSPDAGEAVSATDR